MKSTITALLSSAAERSRLGWLLLRVALAGLIAAHGWARFIAGGVAPFGTFLESQGFPYGFAWAAGVTAIEIAGSISLLLGRLVFPLSLLYAGIYAMGILLVHSKAGWFVVGLGRNGSEYSVLLIVCLLCLALQHRKRPSEA
jgi:putative oxidoreductase